MLDCLARHTTKAGIIGDTGMSASAVNAFLRELNQWAPNAVSWQDADKFVARANHDRAMAAARLRDIWHAMSAAPEANDVFHSKILANSDRQFDEIETTISHAFRTPHPALQGRSYGAAFCDWLLENKRIPRGAHIMEVGCGLGIFANAVLDRLKHVRPELYETVHYTMFDLSGELQASQMANNEAHLQRLAFVLGNIETHDFEGQEFDLVLSNEVISDLAVATVSLDNIENQSPQTPAEQAVFRYDLVCKSTHLGKERKSVVNIGAIQFLEQLASCLKPNGHAILTEYGTLDTSPKAVHFSNHLEFTIDFSHMRKVSEYLGFSTNLLTMGHAMGFDASCETLNFESFSTLAQLIVPVLGHDLPTLAYTRESLRANLGDLIDAVGNLHFIRLDDPRAFSPFRFYFLSLSAPGAA